MSRTHHRTKAEERRAARKAARRRNQILLTTGIIIILAMVGALLFNNLSSHDKTTDDETPSRVTEISIHEAYAEYEAGTFLLDVREQVEWNDFHIPGTTFIPLEELLGRVGELPRNQRIVVVCTSGNRSNEAAEILFDNGFTDVVSMDGGVSGWSDAGYPIEGIRP